MSEVRKQLERAKRASYEMARLTTEQKNRALKALADLIQENSGFLQSENKKDLQESKNKISKVLYQRLALTDSKIKSIIQGINDLVDLEDPVGKVLKESKLEQGKTLVKRSVPLGVVGIVFESRPDVNPQVLSLILKSGNCVVLKGGSEAMNSNLAFQSIVEKLNGQCDFLPKGWAQIITTRENFGEMLKHHDCLDLVVPRGSNELVQSVMSKTKAPVLGHADGICHIFVDDSADIGKSIDVVINAKAQYPSACNAVETLLVHEKVAGDFLLKFYEAAKKAEIELKGCEKTSDALPTVELAEPEDWHTEYGDLILSVKIVSNVKEAIDHINTYGSHHTDAILSGNNENCELFLSSVDSACVFKNASTRFADGFRFGLGAEIGISTSKTHARGPVGLEGLVIYKYELMGNYDVVN